MNLGYIILLITVIFGITVLIMAITGDNPKTVSGGSFDNHWISFNYSSELTIKDSSDDKHVNIEIYNGTKCIGKIFDDPISLDRYGNLSESNLTTINGRKTLKDYDYVQSSSGNMTIRPSAAIYLTEDATLNLIFEPEDRNTFNQISSSLNIKKDDTNVDAIQHKENSDVKNLTSQTGGFFENQWIKFNYPQNLTVTDESTANRIQITIWNDTNLVGDIRATGGKLEERGEAPQNGTGFFLISVSDGPVQDNITTIAGRNAKINTQSTENFQPRPSATIELNPDSLLDIGFEPGSETAYNQVINTLTIKKDNIHPNLETDIYYYLKSWYDFFTMSLPV